MSKGEGDVDSVSCRWKGQRISINAVATNPETIPKENLNRSRRSTSGIVAVVGREMRVAARSKWMYGARLGFALLMAGFSLAAIHVLGPRIPESILGSYLFEMLAWSGMFMCFVAGFGAADRISAERRDGTLGLLFLTDLRGIDVVLGKLAASAFPHGYRVLAGVPVLSVVFLLGGVRPEAVARVALLCLNSLLFSLSAGLMISATSLTARKAVGGSILFISAIVLLPYLPDAMNAPVTTMGWVTCLSPANAAVHALAGGWWGTPEYWASMVIEVTYTVLLLRTAARWTSGAWRQRELKPWERWWQQLVSHRATRALRVRWLDISPIYWILQRRRQRWVHPAMLLTTLTLVLGLSVAAYGRLILSIDVLLPWAFMLNLLLKTWVVVTGLTLFSRPETGELELLLTTAISLDQMWIAASRWFRHYFGGVLILTVLLELALLMIAKTPANGWPPGSTWLLGNAILLIPDCWALAWVGVWMSVRQTSTARALNGVLLRLVYFPWAWVLLATWLTHILASSVFLAAFLVADIGFGQMARNNVRRQLRHRASEPNAKHPVKPS